MGDQCPRSTRLDGGLRHGDHLAEGERKGSVRGCPQILNSFVPAEAPAYLCQTSCSPLFNLCGSSFAECVHIASILLVYRKEPFKVKRAPACTERSWKSRGPIGGGARRFSSQTWFSHQWSTH